MGNEKVSYAQLKKMKEEEVITKQCNMSTQTIYMELLIRKSIIGSNSHLLIYSVK